MEKTLQGILAQAQHLVAFTGAGISTLSGIRDFRGKNGLYRDPQYERIFDIDVFRQDPSFFYTATRDFLYAHQKIRPNVIHQVLARWEQWGLLKCIITQNIDLLHHQAGSVKVFEIHGSPLFHHCLDCGRTCGYDAAKEKLDRGEVPPRCSTCRGPLKPDITFFGENLPQGAFHGAMEEACAADVMLVLGTSLTVYPAASIPEIALRRGAKLIIINDQPTALDSQATLKLDSLEEAFTELQEALKHWPGRS